MEPNDSTKFHLLEINLISAQELKKTPSNMQTYAVIWINPDNKLRSGVDFTGHMNPTWNDKFVFSLENQTMYSTLVVEIYALRFLFKDKKIGVVRIFLDSLVGNSNRFYEGLQGTFRAYQVRRPSGKPQGILNIGVILLDRGDNNVVENSMRLSPAIGHRELIRGSNPKTIVRKGKSVFREIMKPVYKLMPRTKSPKKIYQWPNEYR
ncbi:hypothetical protein ACHQM5_011676 [Ranunculus cassubicifolius]